MENSDCSPDEVIIASSENFVLVYDSNTTKVKKSYKVNKIAPKCLAMIREEYFIGASTNIPEIKTWTVREEKTSSLMTSPCGLVNALAVTNCGTYCVAAFKSEIRAWNVQSGQMLATFTRHYQDVTCLRFTSDDTMLISGGKDGSVLVWMFSKVISVTSNKKEKPLHTWNNHSKEVTDIFVGSFGIYSRVATSSTDMTAKVYELDTGILLTTICLDIPLTSVVMDPLEYYLIVGTQKGSICKINLFNEQPRELHSDAMEKEEVIAHKDAVSCLSMSIVGDKLLSTSTDGTFKVWEVASLSCISSVTSKDGPFKNVFFTLHPTPLLTNLEPYFNIIQLQRSIPSGNQSNAHRPLKLHDRPLSLIHAGSFDQFYSAALLSGKQEIAVAQSTVDQKKAESLYQEMFRGETLSEVRDINAQMYTYMVEHAFKSMEPPAVESENEMQY